MSTDLHVGVQVLVFAVSFAIGYCGAWIFHKIRTARQRAHRDRVHRLALKFPPDPIWFDPADDEKPFGDDKENAS